MSLILIIMVHTGQNFTPELKDFFFEDLKLRNLIMRWALIHQVMEKK